MAVVHGTPVEIILEVYHRPFDPRFPIVAMDEQPIQLLRHTRQVIPARPSGNGYAGHPERVDYEYERNGTACVFMFVAPFHNWRRVSVREHRKKRDWAEEMEQLVMHDFADAEKVTVLLDNLNIHTKGSFYTRFEPEYRYSKTKLPNKSNDVCTSILPIAAMIPAGRRSRRKERAFACVLRSCGEFVDYADNHAVRTSILPIAPKISTDR